MTLAPANCRFNDVFNDAHPCDYSAKPPSGERARIANIPEEGTNLHLIRALAKRLGVVSQTSPEAEQEVASLVPTLREVACAACRKAMAVQGCINIERE